MQKVIIRSVRTEDMPGIRAMIAGLWDWGHMTDDDTVISARIGLYLNELLHGSSFGKIALIGKKAAGAIFGMVRGEEPALRMMQQDMTEDLMVLLSATDIERAAVCEYISLIKSAYADMMGGREDGYDGEIVFLGVEEDARGRGIGRRLWESAKEHFIARKARKIYTYTDTESDFGFYEHIGFERVSERRSTFVSGKERFEMDSFLYAYRFE